MAWGGPTRSGPGGSSLQTDPKGSRVLFLRSPSFGPGPHNTSTVESKLRAKVGDHRAPHPDEAPHYTKTHPVRPPTCTAPFWKARRVRSPRPHFPSARARKPPLLSSRRPPSPARPSGRCKTRLLHPPRPPWRRRLLGGGAGGPWNMFTPSPIRRTSHRAWKSRPLRTRPGALTPNAPPRRPETHGASPEGLAGEDRPAVSTCGGLWGAIRVREPTALPAADNPRPR